MTKQRYTKTHNIFCLDKEKVKSSFLGGKRFTIKKAIDAIIGNNHFYKEQQLKKNLNLNGFSAKLFFKEELRFNSRLAVFCFPFVKEGEPITEFIPKTASSILFIWNKAHIFVITTGQGFREIENICITKFGIQVVSILSAFKITALDSNTIASNIHSRKTIYSNEVDFIDIDNLDTIFKEITGRLLDTSYIQDFLRLDKESKKKTLKITAKNYFQLSNSLDFEGLIHVLHIIDGFNIDKLSDKFNLIFPINFKQNPSLFTNLNNNLAKKIYKNFTAHLKNEFDLFHKNSDDFIRADLYSITMNGKRCAICDDIEPMEFLREAYRTYRESNKDTVELFTEFLSSAKLVAIKDDIVVSEDKLLKHISGELQVDNVNYYIFYGEYYCLTKDYSERLNITLERKLRQEFLITEILTLWNNDDTEDTFNEKVSVNENYVHLHKLKPEFIEFADLIKFDNDKITICHVKDGFNGSMRDLERQVELSIIKMADLVNNNQEAFFVKLFQNSQFHNIGINLCSKFSTEQEFINKMRSTKYRYVIILHVDNENLLQSKSNIAKHCLNSLILKCFDKGVELKINLV